MNWKRHRLILLVLNCLKEHGSWAGKTHLIKTLYLLKALSKQKIPFDFILYKHGPYSFDIEDELAVMKSYSAIASDTIINGYGESLIPGSNSSITEKRVKMDKKTKYEIQEICKLVGTKNVRELECLATITWIIKNDKIKDQQDVFNKLNYYKPHISDEEALTAFNKIQNFL